MKHITSLFCLLIALTINAAEQSEEFVTIRNINVPVVNILKQPTYLLTGRFLEPLEIPSLNIPCDSEEKIVLIHKEDGIKNLLSISLPTSLPSLIHLPNLKPNNTIVITQNDNGSMTTIKNEQRHTQFLCIGNKDRVIIGRLPQVLSITPSTTLTFKNNNLCSVIVCHTAYRTYFTRGAPETDPWLNDGSEKANQVACSKRFTLQEGEQINLTMFSLQDPNIQTLITELGFPQSPQAVRVYVDAKDIRSGDFLEMSLTENNKKIAIVNKSLGCLLALLYTNNTESLTANFDQNLFLPIY